MNKEKRLLNKILNEKRLKDFNNLNPFLFVNEKDLYYEIQEYVNKYNALPIPETKEEDDIPYEFLLDELIKERIQEFISSSSEKAKLLINNGKVDEAISEIYNSLKTFEMIKSKSSVYTMEDLGNLVVNYVETNKFKEGLIGIPSGWKTLDRKTAGFQGGNIYVILARPKLGKSISITYMSNYAYEQGYTPLVVSMEMKAIEMARRYWAIRAGISMNAMKEGRLSTFAETKLKEELRKIENNKGRLYFLEGQFKKTVNEIGSIIVSLKPDIVFIDGGYLIKMSGISKMAKWEKMTEIIEDLKCLTITTNIPIVVSFQFHREAEKRNQKDVGLGNVQLSDAIAQIASVGIGIFKDVDERRRLVEIVGGREGEEGEFLINWDWNKMDFSEIEEGLNGERENQDIIEDIED